MVFYVQSICYPVGMHVQFSYSDVDSVLWLRVSLHIKRDHLQAKISYSKLYGNIYQCGDTKRFDRDPNPLLTLNSS